MKHYARLLKAGVVHESGKRAYKAKDRVYDAKAESPLYAIRAEFKKLANPKKAKTAMWFFKTEKGQYGAGDVFLGLTVPETRKIAKKYATLALSRTEYLLRVGKHEERLCALFIFVDKFKKGDSTEKKKIFDIYLKNTSYVNNWDLVDASAHYIVGAYLHGKPKTVLYKLARSKNLWEKRIAMVATWYEIQQGSSDEAFKIADMLLSDSHDLIHKAIGWMLREAGKRVSREGLKKYLKGRAGRIPRTALRYAIEHFPEKERKTFLAMK
ncbi:DNA alkylation repair protein [Patescibacteria group bacterium]|nr:DNA alkylation repair protein [Patescibacteria group bacterium]